MDENNHKEYWRKDHADFVSVANQMGYRQVSQTLASIAKERDGMNDFEVMEVYMREVMNAQEAPVDENGHLAHRESIQRAFNAEVAV